MTSSAEKPFEGLNDHNEPSMARLSKSRIAMLQHMGIDVYQAYKEDAELPPISRKTWFADLLKLLSISEEDCEFSNAHKIAFDPINKKLNLPFDITDDDAALKKTIWLAIRESVELSFEAD